MAADWCRSWINDKNHHTMEREMDKAFSRAELHRRGISTRTFVFEVKDMLGNGHGNDILGDFCATHHVLSIVFKDIGDKLVYFLVFRI